MNEGAGYFLIALLILGATATLLLLTLVPTVLGWRHGWPWRRQIVALTLLCWLPIVVAGLAEPLLNHSWPPLGLLTLVALPCAAVFARRGPVERKPS